MISNFTGTAGCSARNVPGWCSTVRFTPVDSNPTRFPHPASARPVRSPSRPAGGVHGPGRRGRSRARPPRRSWWRAYVLRDVVAQQRHLPAPAMVAHIPLGTTGPRHLCVEVALRVVDLGTPQAGSPVHTPGYHSRAAAAPTTPTAPVQRRGLRIPIPAQHNPFRASEHSQPGIGRVGIDHERGVAERAIRHAGHLGPWVPAVSSS